MARKLTDEEYESAVQARTIGMAKPATRPITRVPLTIVTTGTNHEMKGILVGVMAGDLDKLEFQLEQLQPVAEAAERVVAMLQAQSNPRRDGGSKALVEACYALAKVIGGEVIREETDR